MHQSTQELLNPNPYSEKPAVTDVFSRIEFGREQLDDTLSNITYQYTSLSFLVSSALAFTSFIFSAQSLISFKIPTAITSLFLFLSGCMLIILNVPGTPPWTLKYKKLVKKYAMFLTRLTGRSALMMYLGCVVTICVWPHSGAAKSGVKLLLNCILSTLIIGTAALGLVIAMRNSLNLEKVRKGIRDCYDASWLDIYRKYAIRDPGFGMEPVEFGNMAWDLSNGKICFYKADLDMIYSVLDENGKGGMNEHEFQKWICADENREYATFPHCITFL